MYFMLADSLMFTDEGGGKADENRSQGVGNEEYAVNVNTNSFYACWNVSGVQNLSFVQLI